MSSFRPLTDEPSDPLVKRSKRGPNSINHSNVLNQISSSRLNLPPMNETLKTYDNNVSGATSSGPNSSHNSSLNGNFQAQDRVLSTPVRLSSPQTPITFPTQRTTPVQNNSYTTLHGTTLSTPLIGIHVHKILNLVQPQRLIGLKHPLVPLSTQINLKHLYIYRQVVLNPNHLLQKMMLSKDMPVKIYNLEVMEEVVEVKEVESGSLLLKSRKQKTPNGIKT